jgi:hypothetical protein
MRRKLEPARWPLRRPAGVRVEGFFLDKDADPSTPAAADVYVALQEGMEWQAYSPVGQHSKVEAAYVLECKRITKEQYVRYSAGLWTPDEYLKEESA